MNLESSGQTKGTSGGQETPSPPALKRLRILFASSEALPYFKSGGLADVSRSLPDALARRGHDVRIIHPFYSFTPALERLTEDQRVIVPWVGGSIQLRTFLHESKGAASGVLVDHAAFSVNGSPYEDYDPHATGRRFALFARGIVHYARQWGADLIHLNDWQTGLVPAYGLVDGISIPTLFSIHNLAYQGLFRPSIIDEIGLPRELFRVENGLEFFGNVSYLKGGLALADRISTVSPTYAREIQTPEYGAGLEGLLRFRSRDLFGILNGIDTQVWNPATDTAMGHTYDASSLATKDLVRAELLAESGMDPARPVLAVISRLVHQKGIDLIVAAISEILDSGASLCVLGDGDRAMEAHLAQLARRFPNRISAVFRFDDALARRLYAAADFFLMPSRYEPCGLGQMIAQRYGTPPIVRATGGLRDTVQEGQTGFCFERTAISDLVAAVRRAVAVWRGAEWDALRRRCMALDRSWEASAQKYEDVYEAARGSAR